ncbi:MAG: hypothetical protein AAGF95_07430 [Chloroflexota bacterium]
MPIPTEDIRRDFVIAQMDEMVGQVLARLPDTHSRRLTSVIIPQPDGRYIIIPAWTEIEQIARNMGGDIRGKPLSTLPGLPASSLGIDQSTGKQEARELRDQQPDKCIVVLDQGTIIGLYGIYTWSYTDLPDDPFGVPSTGALGPGEEESPAPAPPEDNRMINVWLSDHPKEQPLTVHQPYELFFNVDAPRDDAIVAVPGIADLVRDLPADQETIDVLVVLVTSDFTIQGDSQQTLSVPRAIRSSNKVMFTIVPQKEGSGEINALFFAKGRVFQQTTITLQVGELQPETTAVSGRSSGLTVASALQQNERLHEVDLTIIKREGGYEIIAQSGGFIKAILNLSEAQIADQIAYARDELKKIVYTLDNNRYVYQQADTQIPAHIHQQALQALAGVGFDLYEGLFYAPGNGPDARAMGDLLRQRSQERRLHIQIVAERFIFPWALLYDRSPFDAAAVDPEGFWGFKHIVEHTPQFSVGTPTNFVPEIVVEDKLAFGFVLNTTIDTELANKGFNTQVVQPQRDFLRTLPGVTVSEYPNSTDLYGLLKNPDTLEQVLYFYCHAESSLPGVPGGVDSSKVYLSDAAVNLRDLKRNAPQSGPPLKSAPLVFFNACESAELSPYLYDGLVPYLINRGIRGVLGTEVDTPALFAAEFAQVLLERFVAGDAPLGEVLLELRRHYLFDKNNVMGLVYALHSSGDVVVRRTGHANAV